MPKISVNTGSALGAYSSAVVAGNHCYVAGTGGFLPGTTTIVDGGVDAEIRQTMENLKGTLEQARFSLESVVSLTCYLKDIADWGRFNEIYREYFPSEPPARAAVAVNEMPAGANIEVTAVAWREDMA
ncbi:2-iminobutanoate/2-iminopropanoate deaminase [Kibdelosporangium banguiense]|uniref:2-iminobutanoate/2-iminopropanoate deaminase n=1 Tax=Kibdelosporangium banguiense TaxID=1365924 RepID=A0ABS4TXX6_9PSEU|nr:Rid family detoxifying hydrolase [Kibdelosporangium banguiense]MBP2329234.1 2-iminobutanoate/2-iminopropanoate deaminase [Kibdelosporangium banguiense]